MIATEKVQERVQIPLAVETLSAERIAYHEGLVNQAKTAAAFSRNSRRRTSIALLRRWFWRGWNRRNISRGWRWKKPNSE